MRILLIEDNRRLSHELKMSLTYEGYAVDTAFDGVEGQALAESMPYDSRFGHFQVGSRDSAASCS